AVDAANNVYVADGGNNRIQRFDTSGAWERAWGSGVNGGSGYEICTVAADCQQGATGGLGGEMDNPANVAAAAAGHLYQAESNNNRVQKSGSVPPPLSSSATASVTLGSPISDSATLSGGSSPTGTITFTAYGPNDSSCSGAAAYTSGPVPVAGDGMYSNAP